MKRKWINGILIAVAGLLLVVAGGLLWLNRNYKSIIREQLPAVSAKLTDSMYHIDAKDVTIDVPGRSMTITGMNFQPDTAHLLKLKQDFNLPDMVTSMKLKRVRVTGIVWEQLLTNRTLVCDSISIEHPLIVLTKTDTQTSQRVAAKKESKLESIRVGHVVITEPDFTYSDGNKTERPYFKVNGGSISLTDWRFDLNQPNDTSRLFYAASTSVQLRSFRIDDPNATYNMQCGGIEFDTKDHHIAVHGFQMLLAMGRKEFYHRTGYQKEVYEVRIPHFRLDGFNAPEMIYNGRLLAAKGSIKDAYIGIYMDRTAPPNPENKNGKFPHQLLMKLSLPLMVKEMTVSNGSFSYTEKNYKTEREGVVAMQQIHGQIHNVTNIPAEVARDRVCKLSLAGLFKGSNIEATFRFMLGSKDGAFTVDGLQGPIDGTKLNDITRPLALAEITSMQLNSVKFHVDGNERGAKGDLTLLYNNLKVHLLEVEQDKKLDKKSVTTFLANNFLLHPDNPTRGKDVRTAHPSVSRDNTKSFFNLIWKTLFAGMLETAGRDIIDINKMVDKRAAKQEEKRREEYPPNPHPVRKKKAKKIF